MSRQILCLKCGTGGGNMEAFASTGNLLGWSQRRVFLSLNQKPPETHGATVITRDEREFTPMPDYCCDLCNEVISGQIAVAVTTIPPEREIGQWEHEYGRLLTNEEVEAYIKLAK